MANIILDDTAGVITSGGGEWSRISALRYFGGSTIYPPFSTNSTGDTGQYGTLNVKFAGTSIAFHGNTPATVCSQNIFVSIDGGQRYDTSYDDPSPQSAIQWYQSPTLSDGPHTIDITRIAGTSIDYAVVTAGPNTPLSGQRLIVDDDDKAINYSGAWNRVAGRYITGGGPPTGLPFGNSTHQSGTPGSSAIFQFSGTFVAVYSIVDFSHIGTVDVAYTLDSLSTPRTVTVAAVTPEHIDGTQQRENVLLFASDPLPAGVHTLKIEVTGSTNGSALVLDYILYRPSFDTLATMPKLPGVTTTTLSSSPTGTSSGTGPASATSNSVVIGAVVGGIVAVIIIFLLIFLLWRKRYRSFGRSRYAGSAREIDPSSPISFTNMQVSPFMVTTPPASYLPTPTLTTGSSTTLQLADSVSAGRSDNTPSRYPREKHVKGGLGGGSLSENISRTIHHGPSNSSAASTAPSTVYNNTMSRLQNLVVELDSAMQDSGQHSARVVHLQRQVADLMSTAPPGMDLHTAAPPAAVPPPYE